MRCPLCLGRKISIKKSKRRKVTKWHYIRCSVCKSSFFFTEENNPLFTTWIYDMNRRYITQLEKDLYKNELLVNFELSEVSNFGIEEFNEYSCPICSVAEDVKIKKCRRGRGFFFSFFCSKCRTSAYFLPNYVFVFRS